MQKGLQILLDVIMLMENPHNGILFSYKKKVLTQAILHFI